jgi:hypothetical protein
VGQLSLAQAVDLFVQVEQQVCAVADQQPPVHVNALRKPQSPGDVIKRSC